MTHLPDVVVHSDHRRPLPFRITTQAVLMFLDISGFTALCEKYSQAAKTGTEQLTKTLNGYMSALVSEIISYDGDILKFAGDAILSMWPVSTLPGMEMAVENAIQCSLDIQRKHGTYTTNDGVTLKVKIGIAAGETEILIVGNDEERTYIEVGRGIEEVNKAENMCEKGGDVVVAPGAWIHCHQISVEHVTMHDSKFVKIMQLVNRSGFKYRTERTIAVTKEMENLNRSIRNLIIPSELILQQTSSKGFRVTTPEDPEYDDLESNIVPETEGHMRRLRKTVITRFGRNKVLNLKRFISKPVLRKIEDGQPLEYLSEMRQVTMLFINLDVDRSTKYGYLLLMQRCDEVIYANAKRMRGCISKAFAFDKGCTFMVIFGLPGFKHENDSAHALNCANGIYNELNQIVGLKQTSIGVTTGPTYCGIVGHNHRHEYTVIGRRVNMGARLMMHYRGKVICDNTTFYYSKLNETYFIVQEAKELKGLQQVGTVREYRPRVNIKDSMDQIRAQQEQKPIIGRDEELASFELCLKRLLDDDQEKSSLRTPIVAILGEIGMGRTRLLYAFIAAALFRSVNVVLCTLAIGNVESSYYTVRMLLAQLIKCEQLTKEDRVKLLREVFKGNKAILKKIDLLDTLLHEDDESEGERAMLSIGKTKEIIRLVIKHFAKTYTALIFAVDDTQLMDQYSWECMPLFAENDNTMLLLTNRILLDKQVWNETALAIVQDPRNLVVHCSGLSVIHLASIACQFLNVSRIPDSLDHVLRLNSMGIPAWVDLLLREYLYEGVIKIEATLIFNHTETMVVPAPKDLVERKSDAQIERNLGELISELPTSFVETLKLEFFSPNAELVCFMLIQQTDDLKVPTSIASMIQARIDHMLEIDQTVLKSASIIGHFVFREILQYMLHPEVNREELGESIQRLSDSGAFACASTMKISRGKAAAVVLGAAVRNCTCHGQNDEQPMKHCRVLMFLSASLRVTAYEIMLEQNRRPLHMAAAHFMEEKIRRLSKKSRMMNEHSLYESYVFGDEDEDEEINERTDEVSELPPSAQDRSPNETDDTEDTGARKVRSIMRRPSDKWLRRSARDRRREDSQDDATSRSTASRRTRLQTFLFDSVTADAPTSGSLALTQFISEHVQEQGQEQGQGRMKRKNRSKSLRSKSLVTAYNASIAAEVAQLSESVMLNFTGFERLGVLRLQYPQIAEQYRGAGNTQNTVYYLTEAAAACLALFDHYGAIAHLREVNRIFRDLKLNKNPFEGRVANLDNWKPESYDEGQMESLIGQALFGMEKQKKAMPHFRQALKLFGCEQVTSSWKMKIATALEYSRHAKNAITDAVSPAEASLLASQAHCLFYMFEDFVSREDLVGARYAAVQQFTKTERLRDLLGQIEAATCMLKLAHLTNDVSGMHEHETRAKVKCVVAMQHVRNDQLIKLARFYWTAFEIHLARNPLGEAVEAGMAASRMMITAHGSVIQAPMLASLVEALVYSDRVKEAVDVLDIMHGDPGHSESRCWFFCGCIHMVLTVGVRYALIEDCVAYSEEILARKMFVKRQQMLFSLACSLCLYYQRTTDDRFDEWRKVAATNEPTRYDNFISALGFLDLLECKLIQLSRVTGDALRATAERRASLMNESDQRYFHRVISKDIAFAERLTRKLVSLEPRFIVLKAYYAAICDRMSAARAKLVQSAHQAEALMNVSHWRWARHNHQVWFGERMAGTAVESVVDNDVVLIRERRRSSVRPPSVTNDLRSSRRRSSGRQRSSVAPETDFLGDPSAQSRPRQSDQRTSLMVATWLNEHGLGPATSAAASDLYDHWLKSASSSFPFWYILNQLRAETRMLLYYSLPLPSWFAARLL